jgi:hypothetical protein
MNGNTSSRRLEIRETYAGEHGLHVVIGNALPNELDAPRRFNLKPIPERLREASRALGIPVCELSCDTRLRPVRLAVNVPATATDSRPAPADRERRDARRARLHKALNVLLGRLAAKVASREAAAVDAPSAPRRRRREEDPPVGFDSFLAHLEREAAEGGRMPGGAK